MRNCWARYKCCSHISIRAFPATAEFLVLPPNLAKFSPCLNKELMRLAWIMDAMLFHCLWRTYYIKMWIHRRKIYPISGYENLSNCRLETEKWLILQGTVVHFTGEVDNSKTAYRKFLQDSVYRKLIRSIGGGSMWKVSGPDRLVRHQGPVTIFKVHGGSSARGARVVDIWLGVKWVHFWLSYPRKNRVAFLRHGV